MKERLSKFLSHNGVASRRRAEIIIKAGRVSVNGKVVLEPFVPIDPECDHVLVDGISISKTPSKLRYLALHKPARYISDLSDPKDRPLARSLISIPDRIYPVGRLDYASEGLMIFTNDGDFTQKILHPRNRIEREYHVKVQKPMSAEEIAQMTEGRYFEGTLYRVASVGLITKTEKNAWYRIVALEGRNRLIRRLSESLGHAVLRLRRVRIGSIRLHDLAPGKYRFLTSKEIDSVLKAKKTSGGN